MKYICLGHYDKSKFESMTEGEQQAMFDTCFEYDDHLRANGHWAGGEALQPPETALTLYWKNGKVATTDGPYAETKEQLGGILLLEARDLNHAVQLMAQHPALKYGNVADIAPEKYRRDRVFTSATNQRAWLSGSELFQKGANGQEELSARGKALLNATLIAYGDSIVERPIVIEGYWNGNVPADQLRLSRSRAMMVRQYLQKQFQIDSKNLGAVPMKNSPPNGMARTAWDGICLVVLRRT